MFNDKERRIFPYFNGVKNVFADPLAIEREVNLRLDETSSGIIRQLALGEDVPPEAEYAAMSKLVAVVRGAFKMVPFNQETGEGALESDCMKAWNEWCSFMSEKKNQPEPTPISSPPSDGPQAIPA